MGRLRDALARLRESRLPMVGPKAIARDLFVAVILLVVVAVLVVAAAYTLLWVLATVRSVGGIVLGWVAMFTLALLVPVVVMGVGARLYGRLGG